MSLTNLTPPHLSISVHPFGLHPNIHDKNITLLRSHDLLLMLTVRRIEKENCDPKQLYIINGAISPYYLYHRIPNSTSTTYMQYIYKFYKRVSGWLSVYYG